MFKIKIGQFKRCLSLGILFFSGTGFDLLKVKGGLIIWLILLILLNFRNLQKIVFRDLLILVSLFFILLVFFYFKGAEIPYFLFVAITSSYIVLLNYRTSNASSKFTGDIFALLRFYMYLTLVHILFLFIGQSLFQHTYVNVYYRQIGYILWYIDSGGPSFFNRFRLCALAWEPGIWQMYLNMNLLLMFYFKRKLKEILLSIIAIIFTFSTTGIILMLFVIVAYFLYIRSIKNIKAMIIPGLILLSLSTLIIDNVNDKLKGRGATSSMVRFGDFTLGLKMLERSPLIGEDPKSTLNSSDKLIASVREKNWDDSLEGDKIGYLNAEILNGLFIFLLDFGLIVGGYLLYKTYCFNLFVDSKLKNLFICVIIITLMSEPISRTGFFFFFVLASIIINKKGEKESSFSVGYK
ncbi:hypothetical protein [Pedobacter sp. AJM]|uniref:hypothetical protein n=1 Tax=Pedobacter sp. AJM TaxID=2003629 RepID=UPI000B4B9C6A|nr:hypothetical protein [Pedobacter sp. AJM]OWK71249.1 hypothetical protein CBW18_09305 [Pedobacter sp. AJM]